MTALTHPVLFLDFDGTISREDVVDRILEAFADRAWVDVEQEWKSGRIGSRECLRAQMALVRASTADLDGLLDTIELDSGFLTLLEICAGHRIPVHIISDGFDYCIRRLLDSDPRVATLTRETVIHASHLEPGPDRSWSVDFPFSGPYCTHGCATCKPWAIRELAAEHISTLFAGDGLSDRYAAQVAGMVFAKKSLATFCAAQNIAYRGFTDLANVARDIDRLMRADGVAARDNLTAARKAWAPK